MGKVSRRGGYLCQITCSYCPLFGYFPAAPGAVRILTLVFYLPTLLFSSLFPIILALTVAETHCKGEPKSHNISLVVGAATESYYSSLTVSKRTVEPRYGWSPSLSLPQLHATRRKLPHTSVHRRWHAGDNHACVTFRVWVGAAPEFWDKCCPGSCMRPVPWRAASDRPAVDAAS